MYMLSAAVWLLCNSLFFSLRLAGNPGSFPRPLSAAEEKAYLERFAAGDLEARNVLIEHNLRLVAHIVKKYYTQSEEQDDLISIGTIGLIKGISTFKPEKGARLATYAARCVENAIIKVPLIYIASFLIIREISGQCVFHCGVVFEKFGGVLEMQQIPKFKAGIGECNMDPLRICHFPCLGEQIVLCSDGVRVVVVHISICNYPYRVSL